MSGWQDAPVVHDEQTPTQPAWKNAPSVSEERPTSTIVSDLASPDTAKSSSSLGAFARGVATGVAPAAAGLAAFVPGAEAGAALGALGGPAAPITVPVGAAIGGLITSGIGAYAAGLLQNSLLGMIPESVKASVGMDQAQLQKDAQEHSLAQMAGEMVPSLATMKPSLSAGKAVVGAALGGGLEAGREAASGQSLDPSKIALSAAAQGVFNTPRTGLGRMPEKVAPAKVPNLTPQAPVIGERAFAEHLADSYHTAMQGHEVKKIQIIQDLKGNKQFAQQYQGVKEELFHSDDPMNKLSPQAQKMKQEVLDPLAKKVGLLRDRIKSYGVDVGEDVDHYLPRIQVNADRQSIFQDISGVIPQGQQHGLGTKTGALKDRVATALVADDGTRMIVVRDPETGAVTRFANGKVTGKGKVSSQDWKAGEFKFGSRTVKRVGATAREIESNTPIRYHHDPVAALIDTRMKLEKVLTNLDFLDALQHSPESKDIMISGRASESAPKDWKNVSGLPHRFDQTKFAPHVAETLEDIIGFRKGSTMDSVGDISRVMTGSLFWNPMPHIWNVASHFTVSKGLVGGATGLLKGTAKTVVDPTSNLTYRAMKAVVTQNEDYRKFVKAGAGMMSPGVFNKDFAGQVMSALGSKREMHDVARAWGYDHAKALVGGVYRASRKALWGVNDIMLMQAYMAKEASGMTPQAAIKDVERHIPNYQMPSRVMFDNSFGRGISKALRDPVVFAFGRYEYNRMASYGHMVTDAIGKNKSLKDRAHALDQMAMLYFTSAILYPFVFDPIAKAISGNQDATAQRFGANSIPFWLDQYMHRDNLDFAHEYGSKDLNQVLQSTFLPAPATKGLFELVTNTDSFTKQPLINDAHDIPGVVAKKTLPPFREMSDLATGKVGLGQAAMKDFIGVNSPSEEALRKRDYWLIRNKKAELRREKKRREGK